MGFFWIDQGPLARHSGTDQSRWAPRERIDARRGMRRIDAAQIPADE